MSWWSDVTNQLNRIEDNQHRLNKKLNSLMQSAATEKELIMGLREDLDASLTAIEEDVSNIDTVQGSVVALLEQLAAERGEAIKSGDITRVRAVETAIEAKMAALAAAVVAHTPVSDEPPPPVDPVPSGSV